MTSRAKIEYGEKTENGVTVPVAVFEGKNLRSVTITQSINPISETLEINTADFELDLSTFEFPEGQEEFDFREKEKCKIYYDGQLVGVFFVREAKRKSRYAYTISADDYIGFLDEGQFRGGQYVDEPANTVISAISSASGVPITSTLTASDTISGVIPITSCREALQMICFATGAVADTSGTDGVRIYKIADNEPYALSADHIMQGQTVEDNAPATSVTVTQHDIEEAEGLFKLHYDSLYRRADGYTFPFGVGTFTVEFGSPHPSSSYAIQWRQGDDYYVPAPEITIDEADSFHITYTVPYLPYDWRRNNYRIVAKNYEESESVRTEVISQGAYDYPVEVSNTVKLINYANIDSIIVRIADYYSSPRTIKMKIVQGKNETIYGAPKYGEAKYGYELETPYYLGQIITFPTNYQGTITGRIISQKFNLNGNILAKDVIVKELPATTESED